MAVSPGTHLGAYEVLSLLGAGGMGEVYVARDPRLGREVAIKVLPDEVAPDADRLARFEREARAAAALNHPNVVVIHELSREGDAPFVVMELLAGETLRQRLDRGPLRSEEALEARPSSLAAWLSPTPAGSSTATSSPRTSSSPGMGW